MPIDVELSPLRFSAWGVSLGNVEPLIDGEVPPHSSPEVGARAVTWKLETGTAVLEIDEGEQIRLRFRLEDILDAYDTFTRAAETTALKVILTA